MRHVTTVRRRLADRHSGGSKPDHGVRDQAAPLVPTPIYIGQRTRIMLLAAFVLTLVWLAMEAPSVPRLLTIGATVALILSFPVRLLQRWVPRGVAIFVVVGSTVTFAIIGLILVIPFAIREISEFAGQLPQIGESLEREMLDVLVDAQRRGWIEQEPQQVLDEMQGNLIDRIQALTETLLSGALNTLTPSFNIAITTFGVIFIATYLLIDIPRFKEKFVLSFSPAYRLDATQLWSTIGESLSRYLAGLMISILIQGFLATIGLSLLGIPYAVVLGLWMSVTAILPYIGAFLGAIPPVLVALTISWQMSLAVIGLYVLINQIEANLITPRIQGEAVRVHPLIIFIAVIAGSEMAGFLGAVMAVPVLAVCRVLLEFLWLRLRVRHAQDTVFVALGGEDDGIASLTGNDRSYRPSRDEVVTVKTDDVTIAIAPTDIARATTTGQRGGRLAKTRPRPKGDRRRPIIRRRVVRRSAPESSPTSN